MHSFVHVRRIDLLFALCEGFHNIFRIFVLLSFYLLLFREGTRSGWFHEKGQVRDNE